MRVRIKLHGSAHVADGEIEYVANSADNTEVKVAFPGGAIWLEFEPGDRDRADVLIGRLTADGQGHGHPVLDTSENIPAVRQFREQRTRNK